MCCGFTQSSTNMKALNLTFRSSCSLLLSPYVNYSNIVFNQFKTCGYSAYCFKVCTGVQIRAMSVRIFEEKDHAKLYAQYRPTYPESVYETIINYYKEGKGPTCNFDKAVDVGCGSGQSTQPLLRYFRDVTGTDVSAEQISAGKHLRNDSLSFRVGKAEDLSFQEDDSVDLVTVAQAFHWFDREAFYEEVTRVLKPGGALAVYGYGLLNCDKKEAQELLLEYHTNLLGPYWDEGRRHVDNMYAEFSLPFQEWKRIKNGDLYIQRSMPVDAYIGYLSSFSSWRKYLKTNQDSDYLDTMKQRLVELYKTPSGNEPIMTVTWPVFMLIGRKSVT